MKRTLLLPALALSAASAMAQLPDGSVAPDFTANDINGVSHHLYALLDSGYTVVMDISAAWCGPCWNYHNSGNLENLYEQYGPNTPQNKVRVLFIEGESTNTLAQLQGTTTSQTYAGFSQGDWITGTPYPIIDNAQIANDYEITYFPTMYKICPNRITTLVDQQTTAQLWTGVQQCPQAVEGMNASILMYNGETVVCDNVSPDLTIQNMGGTTLTSLNIDMKENGTTIASQPWTGSITTYGTSHVVFPSTAVTNPADVTFEITNTDAQASDNTLDPHLTGATEAMANLTFNLTLDYYCSETTWKLFNSNGTAIHQGGPYNCSSNGGGTDANTLKTYSWTVPMDCYRMELYDAYGDGLASEYVDPSLVDGYWEMFDGSHTILFEGESNFGSLAKAGINVNMPAGIEESTLSNSLNVYPNPSNGTVFLSYDLNKGARVTVEVFNALGELVLASTSNVPAGVQLKQVDMSTLDNGIYFMNINADGIKASRTITLNK